MNGIAEHAVFRFGAFHLAERLCGAATVWHSQAAYSSSVLGAKKAGGVGQSLPLLRGTGGLPLPSTQETRVPGKGRQ